MLLFHKKVHWWGWLILVALTLILGILAFRLVTKKTISETQPEPERAVIIGPAIKNTQGTEVDGTKLEEQSYARYITEEDDETNQATGVQLRGKLSQVTKTSLKLDLGGEQVVEMLLPDKVEIKCEPQYLTAVTGEVVSKDDVYFDYSNYYISDEDKMESDKITEIIGLDNDLVVVADFDDNENMVVQLVAGFGCETERSSSLGL